MLERAAILKQAALCFDLNNEEAGAAVRVVHRQGIGIPAVRDAQSVDVRLQAARHLPRGTRHRQIVLDPPHRFDDDELPVLGLAACLAIGVVHQFQPTPCVGTSQPTRAPHALSGRLPLFDADPR